MASNFSTTGGFVACALRGTVGEGDPATGARSPVATDSSTARTSKTVTLAHIRIHIFLPPLAPSVSFIPYVTSGIPCHEIVHLLSGRGCAASRRTLRAPRHASPETMGQDLHSARRSSCDGDPSRTRTRTRLGAIAGGPGRGPEPGAGEGAGRTDDEQN